MTMPSFPSCYKISSKPHKYCPGCGHPIILKMLGQVIDDMKIQDKVVIFVDIGCSLLAWDFFDIPTTQTHHGRTIPTAVGYKMANPQKIVIAYVGDGGAYAIGLQHTITSALRNDPITTIVVNNTVYGMTGGQSAPTTIRGEATTTNPGADYHSMKMKGPELLRFLACPDVYLGRGTTDKPLVLKQYLKKAIEAQAKGNFALVESISACPTNWKTNARETIARLIGYEKEYQLGEF